MHLEYELKNLHKSICPCLEHTWSGFLIFDRFWPIIIYRLFGTRNDVYSFPFHQVQIIALVYQLMYLH